MALTNCEEGIMENYFHNLVTQQHPSFFQVFLPEHNSTKLAIPRAFIREFKGNIPKKVTLKNVEGRVWDAKVEKIGDRVCISQGWEKYVNDHSLEKGCFLIFKYLQDSSFYVLVFGVDGIIKEEPEDAITNVPSSSRGRKWNKGVSSTRFFKKYGPGFKNYVCIPNSVADGSVMTVGEAVKLRNNVGGTIRTELRRTQDRFVLGYGLRNYWHKCKFNNGDKLQFDVIRKSNGHIKEVFVTTSSREL
ncbi:putative B3 domain-containing protein Os03g0621600 isoform X2 [Silene latifolia]|uniref:putative B3 domain-containing protein Os03g0621600 isoform X2 n=1 Tax=Silene latifolia TaxID=37657 RepID=UPI003D771D61